MARLNSLQILPITAKSLIESWLTVQRHHIYEAYAPQISTSKQAGCDLLLSANNRLIQTAIKEGLTALNRERSTESAGQTGICARKSPSAESSSFTKCFGHVPNP